MADPTPAAAQATSPDKPRADASRRRLLTLLAAAVVVGVALYIPYWLLVARGHVFTDNAYVGADSAEVTPLITGPVAKVLVEETQPVKAGDVLVVLDDSDAQIAVAEARANLSDAERKIKGYFANDTALADQLAARQAEVDRADAAIASAEADLERARTDLTRRQALKESGAVSGDELTDAQNRFSTAQAALVSARAAKVQALATRGAAVGARAVNAAMIEGASVDDNPQVAAARARLRAAELTLSRTVLRAPFDGVVSKKSVELGQQVQAGAPLMTIVPVASAYVDANFKEAQLRTVAIGQPVVLTSDLYGGGVKFHGRVTGLSGGTGSAFSLIPAQNASGNWIKVVQRLPVRIRLDPGELARHPLRVGLSMKATIDTAGPRS
jgi:membrane fusion protein (multidrug efflux system)